MSHSFVPVLEATVRQGAWKASGDQLAQVDCGPRGARRCVMGHVSGLNQPQVGRPLSVGGARPRSHPCFSGSCPPYPTPAVSVALPEWFFSKDKQTAPLILLVLLFGGIVTPLGMAAWYLMGTQK